MQHGESYQGAEWSPVLFRAVKQGQTLELFPLGLSVRVSEGLIAPARSRSLSFPNRSMASLFHLRCSLIIRSNFNFAVWVFSKQY